MEGIYWIRHLDDGWFYLLSAKAPVQGVVRAEIS